MDAGPGKPWPAAGIALSKDRRVPFIPMATDLANSSAWNYAMVQSVGGGFIVGPDTLTFFVGADANSVGGSDVSKYLPHTTSLATSTDS